MARDRAAAIPLIAEVFREHGYEGASLSLIAAATGLGKGSLYNFFPGGKEEMAAAVLAGIEAWFETRLYQPLREAPPAEAIATMLRETDAYFRSGGRVCLVGMLALDATRDRLAAPIRRYFLAWVEALAGALHRLGHADAGARAEQAVLAIQGALVLSRALGDEAVFRRAMERVGAELAMPANPGPARTPAA